MFDYVLAMTTEAGFDEIKSTLASFLGVQNLTEAPERHRGLSVDATRSFIPAQDAVYRRFLGMPATMSLYYSMNSRDREQLLRSERLMAVSAARLVVETDALACMTFSVDSLIMRRTGGVLYLYESFGSTWREPGVISQIPQPWVMTDDVNEGTPPGGSPYA